MVSKLELVVVVVLVFFHLNLVISSPANSSYSLQQQQKPSCHDEERSVLLQLFNTSSSPQSSQCIPDDLGDTSDCCSWNGVQCHEKTGHVIRISLSDCNFSGLVASSLGNLNHLDFLDLARNKFNGPIPASFAKLTQLTAMFLDQNHLSGSIPSFLGALNQLELLTLSWNHFSGYIPSSFKNLTQLNNLLIDSNQLSGPIPSFLGNLSWLEVLMADSNNLQGSIPQSFSNLFSLQSLYLNDNNLNGTVEFHLMFGKLWHLIELELSNNKFELLSDSRGMINASITAPQLLSLGLGWCNTREFPNFLRRHKYLTYLDLFGNKIQGQVPEWLLNTSTKKLKFLNISHNSLSGFDLAPGLVLPWINLLVLDLLSNMLQGPLPIVSPTMAYYGVSDNKLTGEISSWFCNLTSLQYLDLSNNKLSGKLPQCFGNLKALQILNLGNNSFQGILPQTYSNTSDLKMFDVSHNQLQGQLPRSLAKCLQLELLVLSNNDFNDSFPFWLRTLPELKILAMRNGGFHDVIWNLENRYSFPELRILDLSQNNFTGEFPNSFIFSGKSMAGAALSRPTYIKAKLAIDFIDHNFEFSITITNKGVERYFPKIHEDFVAIDLSCNKFEGKIPDFVGDLKGLRSLNISNNNFNGCIPHSLGNLTELEALDLSQNMLSGEIPQQVAQLTFLSQFNVSNNNLTGPIPYGTQLNTFDHTSYEGNLGVCGDHLPKKCGNIPKAPSSVEENDSGSGIFGFEWKFVLAGVGSGLIVGVVLADVAITRRHELFLELVGMIRLMTGKMEISWGQC